MTEAQYIQHLPEKALDVLYASLSVQTMPEGRYDGRAWIHGHPVLGWLASLVWRGKTFAPPKWVGYAEVVPVKNMVVGLLLFNGDALEWDDEITIDYPRLGLTDRVRQVSPTLYLGRMPWRRWTVHFTLSKEAS